MNFLFVSVTIFIFKFSNWVLFIPIFFPCFCFHCFLFIFNWSFALIYLFEHSVWTYFKHFCYVYKINFIQSKLTFWLFFLMAIIFTIKFPHTILNIVCRLIFSGSYFSAVVFLSPSPLSYTYLLLGVQLTFTLPFCPKFKTKSYSRISVILSQVILERWQTFGTSVQYLVIG